MAEHPDISFGSEMGWDYWELSGHALMNEESRGNNPGPTSYDKNH
jgi:hypothetical protein